MIYVKLQLPFLFRFSYTLKGDAPSSRIHFQVYLFTAMKSICISIKTWYVMKYYGRALHSHIFSQIDIADRIS